jgi:hypothetical protein
MERERLFDVGLRAFGNEQWQHGLKIREAWPQCQTPRPGPPFAEYICKEV